MTQLLKRKNKPKQPDMSTEAAELKRLQQENVILKKKLEDAQWASQKTKEGIKILYKELERSNQELKKMDQLKSQFLANVSHEFKNPLTMIKNVVALFLDEILGEINPKQKKMLEYLQQTIDRLTRLVINLLDLAKIESGKIQMNKEYLDLTLLIDEIVSGYKSELELKYLSLKKEIAPDVGLVWADRDMVTEVIINLLYNAIKYTPPKGNVTIKLEGMKNQIRFEIADTGPGIPNEYLDKIFDKFERIAAEKEEGTGLGLPISKDIVELHQGKIWIESEIGKGSKFIFTLPYNTDPKKC